MDVIPLDDLPAQRLTVLLEGRRLVRVGVRWQPSTSTWHMDLESPPGARIVVGRRIALNEALVDSALFAGEIYCWALAGESEPGANAWGNTHRLVFMPP